MLNFKKILSTFFGKKEYVVTIVNVSLDINKHVFNNIKDVDIFVSEINNEKYWDVQKIEKIRRFDFVYDKQVVQSPLHFCVEDVTEMRNCENYDYSFLKKHQSLKNIKYVSNKHN